MPVMATTPAHQNHTNQEFSPSRLNELGAKAIIVTPTTMPKTVIGLLGLYR